jgi:hypothetical protein
MGLGLKFNMNKLNRRGHQNGAHHCGEKTDKNIQIFLFFAADKIGDNINPDVGLAPGGNARADKGDPQHQVTDQIVPPQDAGLKKIAQKNLQKHHQHHQAKKKRQQKIFNPCKQAVEKAAFPPHLGAQGALVKMVKIIPAFQALHNSS